MRRGWSTNRGDHRLFRGNCKNRIIEGNHIISYGCCHKLPQFGGQNNTNLLYDSSGDQNSKMGLQGCVPSGNSRKASTCLTFLASRATDILWLMGPFLCLQGQQSSIFKSLSLYFQHHVTFCLTLVLSPPCHKEPCDYIRPT